jgi:hypothetical protein
MTQRSVASQPDNGTTTTVAELAQRAQMKRNGDEWHGAHPTGNGATKDGFILNDDGTAYDRPTQTRYTSAQVAELFGIAPDEYQPVRDWRDRNGHTPSPEPTAPPVTPATPEQRGITPETLKSFGVSRVQGAKPNRDGWKYPTHHADGKQGRARFKNARAKIGDEIKYQWWKGGDGQNPDGYNLNRIPDDAREVWIVGGEPDVWAMSQNGFDAVCTFGETQGAAALVAALKARRVQVLQIALDNDTAGEKGAAEIAHECQKQNQNFTLRKFEGARGFDVCDQFAHADFDREKFRAAMLDLPEIAADESSETEADKRPNPFTAHRRSLAEIFVRPRPLWLIDGLLLEFGYSAFTGTYGTFKSFALLDMGLCIATGKDYHGRKVKQGTVVYVVAEGAYTTADRAKAWLIRHQLDAPENFHVIEIPAQIGEAAICELFIESIAELQPVFVILDTLTKCNVGADENSSRDMGLFTHGMQEVASRLKCHVIAVHHNGKNGDARGSNALPSNVDTHITVRANEGKVITIVCEKTKVAPFEKFSLIGRVVELGELDEHGHKITSLVFETTDAPPVEAVERADATRKKVLQVLAGMPEGARATAWQNECERLCIVKGSRFYDYRDELVTGGQVALSNRVYSVSTPITPITPNRSESEPEKYSDYSDDVITSEQSELMAGLSNGSEKPDGTLPEMPPEPAKTNIKAQSEPYAQTNADDGEEF